MSFLLHPTDPGRPSVVPMEASIPCKALTQNAEDPLGIEEVPAATPARPRPRGGGKSRDPGQKQAMRLHDQAA